MAMRLFPRLVATGFATALASIGAAEAQTVPLHTLLSGQIQYYSNGVCYLGQGGGLFLRGMSSAVITMPELWSNTQPLHGQARLAFTSASAGTIHFKFWGPGFTYNFSNYSESFNGQQYTINFTMNLPCGNVPVVTGFEAP